MNFNDTFVFHVSHEEFLDGFIRRTHDDLYFMPSADESGYLASTSAIIKFALDSLNDARLYSALTAHFNAGLTLFRILTCVAWLTGTVVIVDQIDASGAVLALSHAVVDVGVAVFSHPSDPAFATVVADQVGAGDGVDAGGGQALVRVELADVSFPGRWTVALEGVLEIDARSAVLTRSRSAFINVCNKTTRQ
jgi:hypothetical protein